MPSYNFTSNTTQEVKIAIDDEFSVGVSLPASGGTFGGGTVNVQYQSQGEWVTYSSGDGGAFTAAGEGVFRNCGDTDFIRVQLTGSTSPSVNVSVANNIYGA